MIHLSEISYSVVKDIREHIQVGEEVEAKVINFEPEKKRIGLSLKALQEAPKDAPVKTPKAPKADKVETASESSEK